MVDGRKQMFLLLNGSRTKKRRVVLHIPYGWLFSRQPLFSFLLMPSSFLMDRKNRYIQCHRHQRSMFGILRKKNLSKKEFIHGDTFLATSFITSILQSSLMQSKDRHLPPGYTLRRNNFQLLTRKVGVQKLKSKAQQYNTMHPFINALLLLILHNRQEHRRHGT